MANKLYPPYIEGNLPAFIKGEDLVIPFRFNRAVGKNQVKEMVLSIRTVQTNTLKTPTPIKSYQIHSGEARFKTEDLSFFREGQFYKVQMACVDNENLVGYYSSVGIIKCTSMPTVEISGLDINSVNANQYEYIGHYSQEGGDTTEKVYSYCFNLYDESNDIVATSGECIHNNSLDENTYESFDKWTLTKALEQNVGYNLEYSVTTLNGVTKASSQYRIVDGDTVDLEDLNAKLHSIINNEDGSVKIQLKRINLEKPVTAGSYILLRSSSEDGFESWNEIFRDYFESYFPEDDDVLWEDHTIQQGIQYKYALQGYQEESGLRSNRMLSEEKVITADFEDCYLFDGERQLRIRFNPKVSSFKSTVLESKQDTIGGKYPFIFRNGNVEYKEFPISGLISLLSDPNGKFLKENKKTQEKRERTEHQPIKDIEQPHWLTPTNMQQERHFKMEVLEWLNNGKPKLFRSPAEGNFIVRLMNCSLTPIDTLGRMLHSFSCNAYEIAEYNFVNLAKYNFIYVPDSEYRTMMFNQIALNTLTHSTPYTLPYPAYFASFTQINPGTQIGLCFEGESEEKIIEIGGTGNYYVQLLDRPLLSFTIYNNISANGIGDNPQFFYGYYSTPNYNNFSKIYDIVLKDEYIELIGLGHHKEDGSVLNIITDILEDIRTKTGKFYHIGIFLRDITVVYPINGKWSYSPNNENYITEWNPKTIYQNGNTGEYYSGDPNNNEIIDKYDCIFRMDKTHYLDLEPRGSAPMTGGRYQTISDVSKISHMTIGTGIYVQLMYQTKEIEYHIEKTNEEVIAAKNNWIETKKEYENNPTEQNEKTMNDFYDTYLGVLENALKEEAENAI